MATVATADGRLLDVTALKPRDVDFRVVATSLSNQCRFNGHVCDFESEKFYSVAEHSAILSDYFVLRGKRDLAKWAHVHDAAEYLVGDCIRPIKSAAFEEAEAKVASAIYARLGLVGDLPAEVKAADDALLIDEAYMFGLVGEWRPDRAKGLGLYPYGQTPIKARMRWYRRGLELFGDEAWT
jgi:hypothetical protein